MMSTTSNVSAGKRIEAYLMIIVLLKLGVW